MLGNNLAAGIAARLIMVLGQNYDHLSYSLKVVPLASETLAAPKAGWLMATAILSAIRGTNVSRLTSLPP